MTLANDDVDYHQQLNVAWHWAIDQKWGLRTELVHKKWQQSRTELQVSGYYYY